MSKASPGSRGSRKTAPPKEPKEPKLSRTHAPAELSAVEWQRALRRQFGREQAFGFENIGTDYGMIMAILGGDDAGGGVIWAPQVIEEHSTRIILTAAFMACSQIFRS